MTMTTDNETVTVPPKEVAPSPKVNDIPEQEASAPAEAAKEPDTDPVEEPALPEPFLGLLVEGYPDPDSLEEVLNGKSYNNQGSPDLLVDFVIAEIRDVLDPDMSVGLQVLAAWAALQMGMRDLRALAGTFGVKAIDYLANEVEEWILKGDLGKYSSEVIGQRITTMVTLAGVDRAAIANAILERLKVLHPKAVRPDAPLELTPNLVSLSRTEREQT